MNKANNVTASDDAMTGGSQKHAKSGREKPTNGVGEKHTHTHTHTHTNKTHQC